MGPSIRKPSSGGPVNTKAFIQWARQRKTLHPVGPATQKLSSDDDGDDDDDGGDDDGDDDDDDANDDDDDDDEQHHIVI